MAPDPRVVDAFNAMKSLGIQQSAVKPVLKKLLKLYGNKWELIQEDNYRTLADAIFEAAENEPPANENHSMTMDAAEPSKKLKREFPEDQDLSMTGDIRDPCGSKPKRSLTFQIQDYQAMDRGTDFVNSIEESGLNLPNITSPSSATSPAASNIVDNFPIIPKPATHPATPSSTTIKQGSSCDIVSSSCGRVKLSLKFDGVCAQPNQCSPSINAVLKFVEEKNFPRKIDGSQFSVKKLLKDVCESFLELANEPSNRCLEENSERNSTKKASSSTSSSSESNKKKVFKIYDITNGAEEIEIPLLDQIGNGRRPKFSYIRENTVYQSAYVQFSLARIADDDCCSECKGDCLLSSVPCACARETGGEFAYTKEGLLREEFLRDCISMYQEPHKHYSFYCEDCPLERAKTTHSPEKCKGHLVRKFIKECWRKCGCNMDCGNRVVQRGITQKLQLFLTSDGKGWGVRPLHVLPKGAFVCEYIGEILTNIELYERNNERARNERHTYPVLLDADWGSEGVLKDEDALCLDATYYGNVGRFLNHRCSDSNLIEIPVQIETPDHHYYHVAFFTKREVNALEELTWDYGIDFDDKEHPIKAFKCCCGSPVCRDRKGKGIASKNMQFKEPASRR